MLADLQARFRARSLLGAMMLMTGVSSPAAAIPSMDTQQLLSAGRHSELDRLSELREAALAGDLSEVIRRLAISAWGSGIVKEVADASPSTARNPVAMLLAEVDAAGERAAGSVRDPAALRSLSRVYSRLMTVPGRDAAARSEGSLRARVERAIDSGALAAAAARLADAIERSLPGLQRIHADASGQAGCDVQEIPGVLCVAGEGANVLTTSYPLVIDLGGDDLHQHSAGAADPGVVDPGGNGFAASVTIDLAGNDRYESTVPASDGARAVQGSGVEGGVGMLIDLAGDDRYSAVNNVSGVDRFARGQGFSAAGVGLLADLGGDDVALIEDRSIDERHDGGLRAEADGQGIAFAGLGVSVNRGGTDSYEVASRPAELAVSGSVLAGGPSIAGGFGYGGIGGAGLFVDDGGTDAMILDAATAPVGPDERRPLDGNIAFQAVPQGMGLGSAGFGVALAGPGPTTWSVRATVDSPSGFIASTWSMGNAALGGYGALEDLGGADVYSATARGFGRMQRDPEAGCSCPVSASASAAGASVESMGSAFFGGEGILHDGGGNDRYVAAASTDAEAVSIDGRPEHHLLASATATTGVSRVLGQGYSSVEGYGLLADDGGDDVYESNALARTVAEARSASGTESATARSADVLSVAQASGGLEGHGELRDLGGADRYVTGNRSILSATPRTEEQSGGVYSRAQGSALGGSSLFLDLDGGAIDTFSSDPPNPACVGTRGEGVWRDCASVSALGLTA